MANASTAHICPHCGSPLPQCLDLSLKEALKEFERLYVTAQLEKHDGNVASAARAMDLKRCSVHRILKRYGLRSGRGPGRPSHLQRLIAA